MLKRVTGERLQNEITLILNDDSPADALIQLEQLNILQKAVNLIDANNIKTDLAVEIKLDYIKCATFCNFAQIALPHFSWVLNLMDKKKEGFSFWRVLWQYKWMVSDLYCHSNFPKQKLLELLFQQC